jgi:Kef-type K+ transport system membrane component KefB
MVIPIMFLITVYSTVDTNISLLLLKTFACGLTLLFTLWLISRFLLDNFLYKVAKTKSNEIFI